MDANKTDPSRAALIEVFRVKGLKPLQYHSQGAPGALRNSEIN